MKPHGPHRSLTLLLGASLGLFLFAGCATTTGTKAQNFPLLYAERPRTILVLPPVNASGDIYAPKYLLATIGPILADAGYYVLPVGPAWELLRQESLFKINGPADPRVPQLGVNFGTDAVLLIEIAHWELTKGVFDGGNLLVSVQAKLISTKSNQVLWEYTGGQGRIDVSASYRAGIIFEIGSASSALLLAMHGDYIPYAAWVSANLLASLPVGSYHPRYGQDGGDSVQAPILGRAFK